MSSPPSSSRRRRRDDDDDGSEGTFEDAVTEQPTKRPRYENEDNGDEDEDEEPPVLPDNFRRSPKGKGRARDTTLLTNDGPSRQEHHPGSIVRVKLTDFVTYSKAEFHPGPNLNMVIGPNGTGKSTLVCAICIGLGWSTAHLGRAKDVTEFVKHGKKSAEIEIELKADPSRHSENQVITHIISKDGNKTGKSTFRINGRKSNAKDVQALARSFSIQVDNLCQFLPQDRVVEFAALSPVDLLVQTQRAAAPDYMSQWHDELKQMGKEHKLKLTDQQKVIDELKRAEDRQRAQEDLVTRLRERNTLRENIRIMEKMKPFAVYKTHLEKHREARERRKRAAADLKRLKHRMAPNLAAVEAKSQYHNGLENHVGAQTRMLTRLEKETDAKKKTVETTAAQVDECEKELQAERGNGKKAKENLNKFLQEIRKLEKALESPPADFDPSETNAQLREKKTQIRKIKSDSEEINSTMKSLAEQARQRQQIIEEEERRKVHLQSQAGRQTSRLRQISREAADAWKWVQDNRNMFSDTVYGPPMVECSVKEAGHADVVETIIGASEMLAFTVTNQADFKLLQNQLYNRLNLATLSLRVSNQPLASFRQPCSPEQLRQLGGQQWAIDLLDGPDAVLAMLCDSTNIHTKAYTSAELSNAQFEALKRTELTAIATPNKMFTVTRRREYGEAGISTRLTDVRKAKHFGDVPIDSQEERDVDRRITELKGEVDHIKQEIAGSSTHFKQLSTQLKKVQEEERELETEKNAKLGQKAQFDGLKPKLENAKRKLQENKDVLQEQTAKRIAIVKKHDELAQKKGQQAIDYALSVEGLRKMHATVLEAEIMRIEAKSDLEQLQDRHRQEQTLLDETTQVLNDSTRLEQELKDEGFAFERQCREIADNFSEEESEYHRSNEGGFSLEQLNNDIEQVQAQLDSLHGGNDNVIKEFEDRAKYIERKRTQRSNIESDVEGLDTRITDLRQRWEPELDQVVGQISEAFAENFSRIHCAGEVAVHKDEDFEQWSIEIRVKFRENEQLSVLDAHRQSGGERAVSTIFYLMALQSLARAPFRVVDEINQGMDPRNERLVHSRMVEIACAEHTSQYFLITPKLLNNLTYHKNMKVHCIASGEYMPEDHRELDFGMLAKKALAIRAGGN